MTNETRSTNDRTMPNGGRSAKPGEKCSCGADAVEVFETAKFGDVGYCGVPHGGRMTGSDDAMTERAPEPETILPGITVEPGYSNDVRAAADALEVLMPAIEDALNLVGKVLATRFEVWDGSDLPDGMASAFDSLTGWDRLNELIFQLNGYGTSIVHEACHAEWLGGVPAWYIAHRRFELDLMLKRFENPPMPHEAAISIRQEQVWTAAHLADELVGYGDERAVVERDQLFEAVRAGREVVATS